MTSGIGILAAAAVVAIAPVDECARDASFVRFRGELVRALDRKDVGKVLATLSPDVTNDFGGSQGRRAFVKAWALDRPRESRLWAELRTILALGCSLDGDVASSPSLLDQLPPDRDAFMSVLAVRPGAAVHAAPNAASAVVARLNWDLLTLADKGGDEGWYAVDLGAGRTGYVRHGDVRSPLDYRVVFQRRAGTWAITALVAGD